MSLMDENCNEEIWGKSQGWSNTWKSKLRGKRELTLGRAAGGVMG